MPVYKNEEKNTWYTSFYYQDWQGNRKRKKKEALPVRRMHRNTSAPLSCSSPALVICPLDK